MNPFGDLEFREMNETIKLRKVDVSFLGDDICVKSSLKK